MTTIKQYYQQVNAAWPEETPKTLTLAEGERAVRRLFRFKRKVLAPYKRYVATSGNRFNGAYRDRRGGLEFRINLGGHHNGGWRDLIHDLSHRWHSGKPHNKAHARLELRLVKEVVKRGWLNPAPIEARAEQEPVAPSVAVNAKLTAIDAKIKRWTTKQKRATTALRKLARQRKHTLKKLEAS